MRFESLATTEPDTFSEGCKNASWRGSSASIGSAGVIAVAGVTMPEGTELASGVLYFSIAFPMTFTVLLHLGVQLETVALGSPHSSALVVVLQMVGCLRVDDWWRSLSLSLRMWTR